MIQCALCDKKWNKENLLYQDGFWLNSVCYFYVQNYQLDNERTWTGDAIKRIKQLGGKYIGKDK